MMLGHYIVSKEYSIKELSHRLYGLAAPPQLSRASLVLFNPST